VLSTSSEISVHIRARQLEQGTPDNGLRLKVPLFDADRADAFDGAPREADVRG
jgi:hypothetical protein